MLSAILQLFELSNNLYLVVNDIIMCEYGHVTSLKRLYIGAFAAALYLQIIDLRFNVLLCDIVELIKAILYHFE